MSIIDKLIEQRSCGIFRPVRPAKYRIRNKKRERLYKCIGCGERKWVDVSRN